MHVRLLPTLLYCTLCALLVSWGGVLLFECFHFVIDNKVLYILIHHSYTKCILTHSYAFIRFAWLQSYTYVCVVLYNSEESIQTDVANSFLKLLVLYTIISYTSLLYKEQVQVMLSSSYKHLYSQQLLLLLKVLYCLPHAKCHMPHATSSVQ